MVMKRERERERGDSKDTAISEFRERDTYGRWLACHFLSLIYSEEIVETMERCFYTTSYNSFNNDPRMNCISMNSMTQISNTIINLLACYTISLSTAIHN